MKKWFCLVLLFVVFVLCYPIWLPCVGTFLLVPDRLEKADCIVLLQADPFLRVAKAAELYEQGYAPKIVFAPSPDREEAFLDYYKFEIRIFDIPILSNPEFMKRAFLHFGKDETGIEMTQDTATSTFDEAVAAKRWMLEKGYRSMLLVSSGYHMRRALMIFRLVFKGTGIRISTVTASNPLQDPPHWWRHERDVKAIFLEYASIGFNLIYHFLLKKGTTGFDTF